MEKIMRYIVTLLGILFGFPLALLVVNNPEIMSYLPVTNHTIIFVAIMATSGLILYFIYPLLLFTLRKVTADIGNRIKRRNSPVLAAQLLGLIIGLILAFLLSSAFNSFPIPGFQWIISIIIYFVFGYIGWTLPSYHGLDVTNFANRFKRQPTPIVPEKTTEKIKKTQGKVLDTSVIIDGRIIDIFKTKFLEGPLIIPIYVLSELQLISDSSDDLKRGKGRRGLDIVSKLQKDYKDDIIILEEDYSDLKDVDSKLIKTAKDNNYKIITNDYNLNKVASLQGIDILNINDLANAVKITLLPGEEIDVSLIKAGKEPGQAIAYLEDGTMIVVENSKHLIGQDLPVVVTSALQTSAGRMIFAKPRGV